MIINVAGDIFLRPPDETESAEEIDLQLNAEDYRKMFKVIVIKAAIQCHVETVDGEARTYFHDRWGVSSYGYSGEQIAL
jgi:hypothetical protein